MAVVMGDQVVHSSCEGARKLIFLIYFFVSQSLNPHGGELAELRAEPFSAETSRWPFSGKRRSHRVVNMQNPTTSLLGFQLVGVKLAFSIVHDQKGGAMGTSKEQEAPASVEHL